MSIFQSKASREKMNTVLSWNKYVDKAQTVSSHFRVRHVFLSQEHFMSFLPFQRNVIIFQSKASRENEHSANFEEYVDISQTVASHF